LQPDDAEWLSFDHLWICDAAGGKWSQIVDGPNPFIPLQWQRELKLPQGAPASRAKRADQLTNRLMSSAGQVVVSKVAGSEHGFMLKSFAALPDISLQQIELAELTDYRQALVAATDVETLSDETGPQLDPVETIDLNQDALALQSACPFRAFASERLGAAPLRALRPGLRPEARVMLVKMALEHLWHRIESSDVLQAALSGDHLEVQIWEVADTVLAVFERKLPVRLSMRYRALEHSRLVRLLLQWLPVETSRAPFVVNRTDASINMDIGGVSLRAHVDRIDQVSGMGSVIVNYDTEPFAAEKLTGDRPDKPTLLLYTLAAEDKPIAILTGCVADERMELSGVQHAQVMSELPLFESSELAQLTGMGWDEFLDR
ncbi:MAG: hypothetical protein HKM98_10475, partial [Gammaproteobacteria bacterium]|nr:hypothetical protein [Gammaproteobacteria bacterium]